MTAFGVLVRQLRNPLLILLLGRRRRSRPRPATPTDGGIIAAIVVLSVGLGFVNEYRSEVAVAALHANIRHEALVWRDGDAARGSTCATSCPATSCTCASATWCRPTCG